MSPSAREQAGGPSPGVGGRILSGLGCALICSLTATACVPHRPGPAPAASESLAWSKLAPALRTAASRGGTESIAVLVRTRDAAGPRERMALERAGLEVLSASGDVIGGRVAGTSLLRVAALPFVSRLEKAQRVRPEQEVPR